MTFITINQNLLSKPQLYINITLYTISASRSFWKPLEDPAEPTNGSAWERSIKCNAIYIAPQRCQGLSLIVCNAKTPGQDGSAGSAGSAVEASRRSGRTNKWFCLGKIHKVQCHIYSTLAVPGALSHRLQCQNACNIQNGRHRRHCTLSVQYLVAPLYTFCTVCMSTIEASRSFWKPLEVPAEPTNGSAWERSIKCNAIYIAPQRCQGLSLTVCNAKTPAISKMDAIGATVLFLYSTWWLHLSLIHI